MSAASFTAKLSSSSILVLRLLFRSLSNFFTCFRDTCLSERLVFLFSIILEQTLRFAAVSHIDSRIFFTLSKKNSFIMVAIECALVTNFPFTSIWWGVPVVFQFMNILAVFQVLEAESKFSPILLVL